MLGYRGPRGLNRPSGEGGVWGDLYSWSACFPEQRRPSLPTVTRTVCLEGATKATDTTSELNKEEEREEKNYIEVIS